MGSFAPKYVPPPSVPTPVYIGPDTNAPDETDDDIAARAEAASNAERVKRILALRRGREGTIFSSFRGVLSPGLFNIKRKTLLGE